MRQWLAILCLAALAVACGEKEERQTQAAETSSESTAAEAEPTPPTETPPAEEPPPDERARDIHGLTVTVNEDGTIGIRGADRWGGRVDTTYADTEYFRNAVPVLARSVTDEQAAGLTALLAELEAGGGAGDESAPAPEGAAGSEGGE